MCPQCLLLPTFTHSYTLSFLSLCLSVPLSLTHTHRIDVYIILTRVHFIIHYIYMYTLCVSPEPQVVLGPFQLPLHLTKTSSLYTHTQRLRTIFEIHLLLYTVYACVCYFTETYLITTVLIMIIIVSGVS